ncbi:type I DNA topoisomerase [Candidatus Fermentibacteria bacterium]|nr:type I DNA topoisomerase [Candidatus Fermentibacteria bacterium]
MAKSKLVVIESPAKAKSLRSYLGGDYEIVASMGHVRDLPRQRLGIREKEGFQLTYTILPEKRRVVEQLRKAASGFKTIYLAADPDREGEAICWHLSELLGREDTVFRRLRFNAVTREAVLSALAHPSSIDRNLVDAQQARRAMDRLVGYKVSPWLCRVLGRGLSAGRVQTVALRLIQEREDEISAFVPVEFWDVTAQFTACGVAIEAGLLRVDGRRADGEKNAPRSSAEVEALLPRIRSADWAVARVEVTEAVGRPGPPFITSTLQQAASTHLSLSPSRTMRLAQDLYEGMDVEGHGHTGLITYMRTDSVRVEPEAVEKCREYIEERWGGSMLPPSPRRYRSSGGSQDAHEAIRPADVRRTPESLAGSIPDQHLKLYSLIWRRFTASQAADSRLERTKILFEGGGIEFSASGERILFEGFTAIDPSQASVGKPLPGAVREGPAVLADLKAEQKHTRPPSRFSEAGLVAEMKKLGIGRPSTYVRIIDTLKERGYVNLEHRRLFPTELGTESVRLLVRLFPHIFDTGFTAEMEELLDSVASGRTGYVEALERLSLPLETSMRQAVAGLDRVRAELAKDTGEKCPRCGAPLKLRVGRFGRFVSCSAWPDCKYSRPEEEKVFDGDRRCPECGGRLMLRDGRFGSYLACEKAPECGHTEPVPTGVPCPVEGCGGELVQKRSRKGRVFYSCNRYPACDFAMWNRPLAMACERCGFPVTEEYRGGVRCPRCRKTISKS